MKHKKNRILTFLIFSGGALFGACICFFLIFKVYPADRKTTIKEIPRSVEFITTHTLCSHKSTYTETSLKDFSSKEQIKSSFPEWKLDTVTDKKIVLIKDSPDYCDQHYFAYLKDKKIYIDTLNGDKSNVIDVSSFNFTEQEAKTLKDGIYLNGKEMYTAFIEDFSS